MSINSKLICVKSDVLEDWYLIELAEHPRVQEFRALPSIPNAMGFYCSSRISDSDIEGHGVEMLAIADAIEARGRAHFKRCAVDARTSVVEFWSPRNSQRHGEASRACADDLAKDIRRVIGASVAANE